MNYKKKENKKSEPLKNQIKKVMNKEDKPSNHLDIQPFRQLSILEYFNKKEEKKKQKIFK
jgi:hypothetical protein